MRLDDIRAIWEEWSFSARIDPFEHALSILGGLIFGFLIGVALTWAIVG